MNITFEPKNADEIQYELKITATLSQWKDISDQVDRSGYSELGYALIASIAEITKQAERNFTNEVVHNTGAVNL